MKIVFTKVFLKSLWKIDDKMQDIIIKKIELLKENSDNLDIKKLNPKNLWFYRLRIWKYRLVFEYQNQNIINLLNIDNRDSIYK